MKNKTIYLFIILFSVTNSFAKDHLSEIKTKSSSIKNFKCTQKPNRLFCEYQKDDFLFFSQDSIDKNKDFKYFKKLLSEHIFLSSGDKKIRYIPTFSYSYVKGKTWLIAEVNKEDKKVYYAVRMLDSKYLMVTYQSKKVASKSKLETMLNLL